MTGRLVGPLVDARTYRAFAFLVCGVLLAPVWFALLLAGWLAVGLTSPTPLVMPVLVAYRSLTRSAGRVERSLAKRLLGLHVPEPSVRSERHGFWQRAGNVLTDPRFWWEQTYLLQRTVLGFGLGVGAASWLAGAAGLVAAPAYYRAPGVLELGFWDVNTLPEALVLVAVGLAGLVVWAQLVRGAVALEEQLAWALLGRRAPATQAEARARRRHGVLVHVFALAAVNVVLVVIWAATTQEYFWPVWTLLPPGLVLAVHAWIVQVANETEPRTPSARALSLHAGVALALSLFLVGVWAVTSRGTFWPIWPIIGLASALLVHWLARRHYGDRSALTRRIDELTTSRAGVVDSSDAAMQRIERDIHDGAQARLVALGMSLGMAEQKLAADPDAARELVAEARRGVGVALEELRGLARGIRPPILADRGLEAAIRSLADVSALDVRVLAAIPTRPPAPVETAAYFVAAEALANATKHAHARGATVRVDRRGDLLTIEVTDDGPGGADARGSGLTGLRRRVEALDGTLAVESPPGGPTTVKAVLPCGS